MKPDMTVTWKDHLKNGWIWKANVELAMQDSDTSEFYSVDVYVCLLYTSPSPRD